MSDKPFDQYEHPVDDEGQPKSPALPRPAQTEAQRQFAQTAEMQRIAALNYHVRKTVDAARAALEENDPDKALEILQEAAGKYTRFGGPAEHWKDGGK
jgi:hypothetical protein